MFNNVCGLAGILSSDQSQKGFAGRSGFRDKQLHLCANYQLPDLDPTSICQSPGRTTDSVRAHIDSVLIRCAANQ